MSGTNFVVPPRSWDSIAAYTDDFREKLSVGTQSAFPIMTMIERVIDESDMATLLIGDKHEMGRAEGYTCPKGTYIELREDVYYAAWRGDGRARFTAAHELGHYFMHTNIPMARETMQRKAKPFELSEQQANQFAAELLMPRSFFSGGDTPHSVMLRHEVSWTAAKSRLNFLQRKGLI